MHIRGKIFFMKRIYISKNANKQLTEYVKEKGYTPVYVETEGIVPEGLSCHPDIFLCKMGVHDNSPLFFAGEKVLGMTYPDDIAYNAACTGKYFLHNLSFTDEGLLRVAKEMDMKLINVRQGYTKCSIAVVDENSLITYDEGIVKACSRYPELDVLKITPGHILLEGYDTGFIGGTCGRIGNELLFHGDLSAHPDFERIREFITKRNLGVKWFPDFPLTDIGSIL